MSQERIEYAAVELYYASGRYRVMPYSEARNDCEADAARILAKADVSMFSDEAIERAARVLEPTAWNPREFWFRGHGESIDEARGRFQQSAIARVRAVVAALKGDA